MKEGQKQIYYLSGASKAAAAASPVLERLNKQGYEVLFALDQIDEIALQGGAHALSPRAEPPARSATAAAAAAAGRTMPRRRHASFALGGDDARVRGG
jgi:hypothetical protein